MSTTANTATPAAVDDADLVARVLGGDKGAYEVLIRRHNQRLFRAARAIVRDDDEAEDVVQHVWVAVYQKLAGFRGDAALTTWLTRIVVNEALGRRRRSPAWRPTVRVRAHSVGCSWLGSARS